MFEHDYGAAAASDDSLSDDGVIGVMGIIAGAVSGALVGGLVTLMICVLCLH